LLKGRKKFRLNFQQPNMNPVVDYEVTYNLILEFSSKIFLYKFSGAPV